MAALFAFSGYFAGSKCLTWQWKRNEMDIGPSCGPALTGCWRKWKLYVMYVQTDGCTGLATVDCFWTCCKEGSSTILGCALPKYLYECGNVIQFLNGETGISSVEASKSGGRV